MTKKNTQPDSRILELSSEVEDFIISQDEEIEMYSHRTSSREIAQKIIEEGFKYTESFQKTTDQIVNDLVYLRYWDSLRKHYGNFIVVIGISKKVFVEVMEKLKSKFEVQQALSTSLIDLDSTSEDEFTFLLPREFVKGFIDRNTGDIVANPTYNPHFLPDTLEENIALLNNN